MKNKIENQIKKQLENREIPVSENAWEKLSEMMNEEIQKEKTVKFSPRVWLGIAASIVIFIGLFFLLRMSPQADKIPEIVKTDKTIPETEPIKDKFEEAENEEIKLVENQNSQSLASERIESGIPQKTKQVLEIPKPEPIETQSQIAEMKLPEKELIQNLKETEDQLATNETPEKEEAGKSYVDAEMLLYSIENNKTINDSKSGSKLVIIDFNN